jgi:hypothetical protein
LTPYPGHDHRYQQQAAAARPALITSVVQPVGLHPLFAKRILIFQRETYPTSGYLITGLTLVLGLLLVYAETVTVTKKTPNTSYLFSNTGERHFWPWRKGNHDYRAIRLDRHGAGR